MTEITDVEDAEIEKIEAVTQPEDQNIAWHIGGFSKITATTLKGPCMLEFPSQSNIEDLSVYANLFVNIVSDIAAKHAEAKAAEAQKNV